MSSPRKSLFTSSLSTGVSAQGNSSGVTERLANGADTQPQGQGKSSGPLPRPLELCPPPSEAGKQKQVQVSLPFSLDLATDHGSQKDNRSHNWRFSFDDFVVGPSNELAFAASKSICGEFDVCDSLYLHSAPGLGKTHLMQAVGKHLVETCNRATPRLEYLTAEEFASRFYLSLKSNETDKFKARYRDIDALLLEDVHFFQGKEKMQAELLGTIKSLADRGGKVIFTSSFAAGELKNIEDQLLSRLSAGFLAPIERPDEETRKRIFRKKAALFQVQLPEDVESLLAHHIKFDIRQIESCLRNLILKARIANCGITLQMAWDVVANYAATTPILDLASIISCICKAFGLSEEQLYSSSRRQEYVVARNTAFYLARKHTDLSLEAIGRQFNRKHSTVLKGLTNIEREMSRQTPQGRQATQILAMIERNGNVINRPAPTAAH